MLGSAVKSVDIPVSASLNGTTNEARLHYARRIEAAGAQALELNVPRFEDLDSLRRQCEFRYTSIVRVVKLAVKIPIFTDWSCFIAKAANDTSGRQDHRTSADVPVGTPISLLLACVSES